MTRPLGRRFRWRHCGMGSRSAAWATSRPCCTARRRPQRCGRSLQPVSGSLVAAPFMAYGMGEPVSRARVGAARCTRIIDRLATARWHASTALLLSATRRGWYLDKNQDQASRCLQESRATLERLKRMAGFESQDFDPLVRNEDSSYNSMASPTLSPIHWATGA